MTWNEVSKVEYNPADVISIPGRGTRWLEKIFAKNKNPCHAICGLSAVISGRIKNYAHKTLLLSSNDPSYGRQGSKGQLCYDIRFGMSCKCPRISSFLS